MNLRLILSLTILSQTTLAGKRNDSRPIQVLNGSGRRVEIFWVDVNTREEVLMSTPYVMPGADFALNSFVGHEFMIKELPDGSGQCQESECKVRNFVISDNDEQLVKVDEEVNVAFVDNKLQAQEEAGVLIKECRVRAEKMIEAAGGDKTKTLQGMDELVKCVEGGVSQRLVKINEEIAYQSHIRMHIASSLENYTCADDSLNSTEDLTTEKWVQKGVPNSVSRTVHIKHDRPASRIHVIDNFINPDECKAMEDAAAKSLHRATVADGKGGSRLSENRKAMQAGIKVPWKEEKNGNPIARLSRRVYDYVNHVLDLSIEEHGQEDLMSIQYFGRGKDDKEPDRYTPHCDGECTGLPHKTGTRMATMVIYCDVADKGGHTNFRNSGVHVKPTSGSAIFFSYIDPDTHLMDKGFTEHSGCPVYEGTKRIVTQWVRLGVDSENTWDSFNTLGIKKSEVEAAGGSSADLYDADGDDANDEEDYDDDDDDEAELEEDDDEL